MTGRLASIGGATLALFALDACEVRDTNAANEASPSTGIVPQQVETPSPSSVPAPAAPTGPLAEADSQNGDFRMAVTEAVRSGGVLTVKARVTLLEGETGSRRLLHDFDTPDLYVGAGDQKYMVLKDNEGEPLTTAEGYNPSFRRLGDVNNWWGKFPAPPPEVKTVTLYFKYFLPVENIPITDR